MAIRMPSKNEVEEAQAKNQKQRAQELVDETLPKVESGATDITIWFQLAAGYMGLDEWDMAADVLDKSPETDDRFTHGWANISLAYRELGKFEKAVDAARKSLNLSPRNLTAQVNLGLALVELGRFNEAKLVLEKVLQVQSNQPMALVGLIATYRGLGDVDAAEKMRQRAANAGIRIV